LAFLALTSGLLYDQPWQLAYQGIIAPAGELGLGFLIDCSLSKLIIAPEDLLLAKQPDNLTAHSYVLQI
jgi:hypothetical protein